MENISPIRRLDFAEENYSYTNQPHQTNTVINSLVSTSKEGNSNVPGAKEYEKLSKEEKKVLRETASLFLCCRKLISPRQISFLNYFTHLKHLNLHMNHIKKLENNVFASLIHLEELDLSGNEIEKIESSAFNQLNQLKRLNLSSNCLSNLNPCEYKTNSGESHHNDGLFSPLIHLESLNLAFNNLVNIQGLLSIPAVEDNSHNHEGAISNSYPVDSNGNYFRKIDLCGNNIKKFESVKNALKKQMNNLKEVRLKVHAVADSNENNESKQVHSRNYDNSDNDEDNNGWQAELMRKLTKENPFLAVFNMEENTGINQYMETVLAAFPQLTVLDGVPCGVNPLEEQIEKKQKFLELSQERKREQEAALQQNKESNREKEDQLLLNEMNHYYSLKSDIEALKDQLKTIESAKNTANEKHSHRIGQSSSSNNNTNNIPSSFQNSPYALSTSGDSPATSSQDTSSPASAAAPSATINPSASSKKLKTQAEVANNSRKETAHSNDQQEVQNDDDVVAGDEDSLEIPVFAPPRPFISAPSNQRTNMVVLSSSNAAPVIVTADGQTYAYKRHSYTTTSPLSSLPTSPSHVQNAKGKVKTKGNKLHLYTAKTPQSSKRVNKRAAEEDEEEEEDENTYDDEGTYDDVSSAATPGVKTHPSSVSHRAMLRWRPKRVSRGTNTEDSPEGITVNSPSTDPSEEEQSRFGLIEELKQKIELQEEGLRKLQEQVALRTIVEPLTTLQQQQEQQKLELAKQQEEKTSNLNEIALLKKNVEIFKEKSAREKEQYKNQINALKDEILRQKHELTLMEKKAQNDVQVALRKAEEEKQNALKEEAQQREAELQHKEAEFANRLETERSGFQAAFKEQESYFHYMMDDGRNKVQQELQNEYRSKLILLDRVYQLSVREATKRHEIESMCASEFQRTIEIPFWHQLHFDLSHQLELMTYDRDQLAEDMSKMNQTWEQYCSSLQGQYNEALQHAETEVEDLLKQLERLKKVNHDEEKKEVQQESDIETTVKVNPVLAVNKKAPLQIAEVPFNCEEKQEVETKMVERAPSGVVDTYWQQVCERIKKKLNYYKQAEEAHLETERTLTRENSRLFTQLTELQAAQSSSAASAEAEKENLLRTLKALKEDLQQKEEALNQLEEEANDKIEEKRERIKALEVAMEEVQEDYKQAEEKRRKLELKYEKLADNFTALKMNYKLLSDSSFANGRGAGEEKSHRRKRSSSRHRGSNTEDDDNSSTSSSSFSELQLNDLLSPLEAKKRQNERDIALGTLQEEKKLLVSTLAVAREQLARASQQERLVSVTLKEKEHTIALLSEEKAKLEASLQEVKRSSKLQQKNTFKTFMQLMNVEDSSGAE